MRKVILERTIKAAKNTREKLEQILAQQGILALTLQAMSTREKIESAQVLELGNKEGMLTELSIVDGIVQH